METLNDITREKRARKVTLVGSLGNLLLLIFKFVAGVLGHSSAMIADAVHSLSDFVTDVIVLIFIHISAKPSDDSHDYGHGKFETLATVIVALMLIVVGVGIFWSGSVKIWDAMHGVTLEAPGMIALIAALLSIVIKEGLFRYTMRESKRLDSAVMAANAWHHRSDAFSSIGTTAGIAGAIFFGIKGRILDPLAAVVVSFFIVKVGVQLLRPGIAELLEASLPADVENKIIEAVNDISQVHDTHGLRTRRIGHKASVELHVRMRPDMTVKEAHDITRLIERRIRQIVGEGAFVNTHVEPLKTKGDS